MKRKFISSVQADLLLKAGLLLFGVLQWFALLPDTSNMPLAAVVTTLFVPCFAWVFFHGHRLARIKLLLRRLRARSAWLQRATMGVFTGLCCLAFLGSAFEAGAQQVTLIKAADVSMVESGEEVEFTLTIGCSSLLNDCTGAILTDILPAEAIPVAASLLPVLITSSIDGMSYPITPSYNPMTNTITWDFTMLPENGLPDGTSLQIKYTILVNGGTVPNGEIIKNIANLISDNAGTGKDSTETTVQASPQWSINKTLRTGLIFHDFNETYRITINNTGGYHRKP